MRSESRYFDYLETYETYLCAQLNVTNIESSIEERRATAITQPEAAESWFVDLAKNVMSLVNEKAGISESFADDIDAAYKAGLIGASTIKVAQEYEMAKKASDGTAAIVAAQTAIILADDMFRALLVKEKLLGDKQLNVDRSGDTVFTIQRDDELDKLSKRARNAAALENNQTINKTAGEVRERVEQTREAAKTVTEQLKMIFAEEGSPTSQDILAAAAILQQSLIDSANTTKDVYRETQQKVDEILSEHDFVNRLLEGRGNATDKQFDVLAFPKTKGAKSTILKLSGSAGTGKTLCLIAKTLRDTRPEQGTLDIGIARKNALFVCFNKALADHVRSLCEAYPGSKDTLEIESFDKLINSLVKPYTDRKFGEYTRDVRYPMGWSIHYETAKDRFPYTMAAMKLAANKHPELSGKYYLEFDDQESVEWVSDEIRWLESRFETVADARSIYPDSEKCKRTGRGNVRKPGESDRKVILDVWDQYCDLLKQKREYTIEQAIWRLRRSKQLPKFDAIAIDECQDLSLHAVRTLAAMRRSDKSHLYITGDEDQKIYRRDFTWKELDPEATGHSISLDENKRNHPAIGAFASRLIGAAPKADSDSRIHFGTWSDEQVMRLIKHSSDVGESFAVIGGTSLKGITNDEHLAASYYPELGAKGLEFDNVLVDYMKPYTTDSEEEKRIRYVHFTRARKRLYIRHGSTPPPLLKEVYSDYLQ